MTGNTALQQLASKTTVSARLRLCACVIASVLLVSGCASQRERLANSIGKRANLSLPENHSSFINRWYAGVALGGTQLDPDLDGIGFTLQKGNALGTQMRLGYDLHNLFSVEMDTSVLGAAEFESTAEVKYTSLTASGLIYGLTGNSNRSRRQDWSAFARLGYSYSSSDSNVQVLDGRDLSGAVFGLGVEYGMANGLGLRMEATRFHDEAMLVGLGAVYRFGNRKTGRPSLLGKKKNLTDQQEYYAGESTSARDYTRSTSGEPMLQAGLPGVLQQGEDPAVNTTLTPRVSAAAAQQYLSKVVVATVKDLDGDGVSNESDECANTRPGTSVDVEGCGLFDGVIEGVTFANGSAGLNSTSKRILDRLATRLVAFPEVRVEVQAHSDDKGPESINKSVSETRAKAVRSYLIRHGVSPEQLEAVGMGESRPRSDAKDEYGRLANRRIELLTLPDLDIVPRHVTMITPKVDPSAAPYGSIAAKAAAKAAASAAATTAAKTAARADTQRVNGSPASAMAAISTTRKTASNNGAGTNSSKNPQQLPADAEPSLAAASTVEPVDLLPAPVDVPGLGLNGVLPGVAFDGRTDKLSTGSETALNGVVSGLTQHPTARVAIMVHTDNQGTEEENLDLSARQATAISAWLSERGIDKNRMEIEGYGESLPVVQNISEADRQRNRRVELRVISK